MSELRNPLIFVRALGWYSESFWAQKSDMTNLVRVRFPIKMLLSYIYAEKVTARF
jgi:hypothetical protein